MEGRGRGRPEGAVGEEESGDKARVRGNSPPGPLTPGMEVPFQAQPASEGGRGSGDSQRS